MTDPAERARIKAEALRSQRDFFKAIDMDAAADHCEQAAIGYDADADAEHDDAEVTVEYGVRDSVGHVGDGGWTRNDAEAIANYWNRRTTGTVVQRTVTTFRSEWTEVDR